MSKANIDRDTFIFDLVRRKQMRQIGTGKFGSVFATPTDTTVIKVCRDPAYRSFLVETLKHQDNPWFPQIKSATEFFPSGEPAFLVVVMERLRKGERDEIAGALCFFDNERFKDITAMVRMLGLADIEKMQHLREVRRVLIKLYKNYGPDFHKGNIMFRGDQAVITDPIVSGEPTIIITEPM